MRFRCFFALNEHFFALLWGNSGTKGAMQRLWWATIGAQVGF